MRWRRGVDGLPRDRDDDDENERNRDDGEQAQGVRANDETGGYETEDEPDQAHQHEQKAVHADITLRAC